MVAAAPSADLPVAHAGNHAGPLIERDGDFYGHTVNLAARIVKADVFDYIERFYNAKRRHSTIGYLSPVEFEEQMRLA